MVEAGSIATRSTSASTALLQYELDTPLHILAYQVGEATAVRSYQLCAEAIESIMLLAETLGECAATRRVSLQYASKRGHVEQQETEHTFRKSMASRPTFSGTRSEETLWLPQARRPGQPQGRRDRSVSLYPLALTGCPQKGGRVMDRTKVVSSERSNSGYLLRTEKGHLIHAEHVVMATGYQSQRYVDEPGIQLHSTYAIASERIPIAEPWYRNAIDLGNRHTLPLPADHA